MLRKRHRGNEPMAWIERVVRRRNFALRYLVNLSGLVDLELQQIKVTDAGMGQRVGLKDLQFLDLTWTGVTSAAAPAQKQL